MPKKSNNTGGKTANIDSGKPKKPKPAALCTITVMDDGQIAGDFWIFDEDDVGRRKKWTVDGTEFIKFLAKAQPNNVRVVATIMNVQVCQAGLPDEHQAARIHRNPDGTITIEDGAGYSKIGAPGGDGVGTRAAERAEVKAAQAIGLDPANTAAALPGNSMAARGLPAPTPIGAVGKT